MSRHAIVCVSSLLLALGLNTGCDPALLNGLSGNNAVEPSADPVPSIRGSAGPEARLNPDQIGKLRPDGVRPSVAVPSPLALPTRLRPILASGAPLTVVPVLKFVPGLNVQTLFQSDSLDYSSAGAPTLRRRYTLYLGHGIQDAQLEFSSSEPVSNGSGIQVFSSNGTLLGEVKNGPVAIYVPGNVAFLEASWDGNGTAPLQTLDKITMNTLPGVLPEPVTDNTLTADRFASLPVSFNSPILLHARSNQSKTFFMTVKGMNGKNVDIVLDGPGEVIASHLSAGFLLPGSSLGIKRFETQKGGLMTFAPGDAQEDTILITVTLKPVTGQLAKARFSVNHVSDQIPLTVRFAGNPAQFGAANNQALIDRFKEVIAHASRRIYQSTEGRARIGKLKLLLGNTLNPTDIIQARVDPFPYPHPFWREHVTAAGSPLALIEVDQSWWERETKDAGRVLAHEIFHQRYALPDEYTDVAANSSNPFMPVANQSRVLCPHSIMGNSTDNAELCWSGNHNPSGETQTFPFLNPSNLSMWELIASRLGTTAPNRSPALPLRPEAFTIPGDAITLPLALEVVSIPDPVPLPTLPPIQFPF
ncbi:MAG: hypothetical protein IV090_24775 [Candidatus Sericytochromatia bacterium]|nr:hypothetical protein [Candidatus Sericytochromatia bacterium]